MDQAGRFGDRAEKLAVILRNATFGVVVISVSSPLARWHMASRISLVFQRIGLSIMTSVAIACQANPSVISSATPSVATPAPTSSANVVTSPQIIPTVTTQFRYQGDRFEFEYPGGLVLEEASDANSGNAGPAVTALELWTTQDAEGIQNGAYEGSEYPANVSVTIHDNAQGLTLMDWVKQSNWFAMPDQFNPMTIDGQSGISFHSTGLYESQHVALPSPDGSQIILISYSMGNDEDTLYKQAFDAILASFRFI